MSEERELRTRQLFASARREGPSAALRARVLAAGLQELEQPPRSQPQSARRVAPRWRGAVVAGFALAAALPKAIMPGTIPVPARPAGAPKARPTSAGSGVTGSPAARLTIEQQVTPDILFTYITDVTRTNNQLVRVEWAINRQVSAILVREETGYIGMDFAWKKRFK